ncbi:hypothetical protein E3P84_00201 [Wallemia ichthyophaga]|nr:hypothetical protein E3P98_02513 [Wallemia ichthyophaga]TIB03852.1 hypothetical protein E3P95_00387 [Wallemia ichthyophaga]TIB04991.1 hypothetical protein E3P94_00387 [Wallemia ichthyophaga]TIB37524.1 hypothetical protein E3P84_00201 [Wallemia ichthyophaga]TIB44356.1 hypothetical protein E3P83_00201 [Wallemia ichthyophaga]
MSLRQFSTSTRSSAFKLPWFSQQLQKFSKQLEAQPELSEKPAPKDTSSSLIQPTAKPLPIPTQTHTSHSYSTAWFKISHKKLNDLGRQIAHKPIDSAILQMQFSEKRASKRIKSTLVLARDHAIAKGLDRHNLVVNQAYVNRVIQLEFECFDGCFDRYCLMAFTLSENDLRFGHPITLENPTYTLRRSLKTPTQVFHAKLHTIIIPSGYLFLILEACLIHISLFSGPLASCLLASFCLGLSPPTKAATGDASDLDQSFNFGILFNKYVYTLIYTVFTLFPEYFKKLSHKLVKLDSNLLLTKNHEEMPTPGQLDTSAIFNADKAARNAAQEAVVKVIKDGGPAAVATLSLPESILGGLSEKKNETARQGAAELISAIVAGGQFTPVEPYLLLSTQHDVFGALLEAFADKSNAVRDAAVKAVEDFVAVMNNWATAFILPPLLEQIRTAGKWQIKTGGLAVLNKLVVSVPDQMARLMPDCMPVLAEVMWDTKSDVKKAARSSLKKLCSLVNNKDIEKFIPALQECLINPVEKVPTTIQVLAATTFVSEVDSPTLALMEPLLSRGLAERQTALRRKTAVIIDNMSTLVDNERIVRPFLPKLLPGLIKIEESVADPEARSVVNRAIKKLRQVGSVPENSDGTDLPPIKTIELNHVVDVLVAALKNTGDSLAKADDCFVAYIARLGQELSNARCGEETEWTSALVQLISLQLNAVDPASVNSQAKAVVKELLEKTSADDAEVEHVFPDEEEGEDLCNCTFSLAYGAKILLNTATLRLKRGHRYGLLGRNGTGKSTLMRAIVNGQVEGFPSPDEVRTFYVEHDIDGSEEDTTVVQFVQADKRIEADEAEIRQGLATVGFSEERQDESIGSLSGGWKMKLALARAILFKADILLLDEPTNHLDVLNVQWIIDYLTSLTHCTSIIVSHDSEFLNKTITDVIYLSKFKIKRYPGNLENFAKLVPEAKSFFEIAASEEYKFILPEPPMLEGVKTKEKSLLKMRKVNFQYPTAKVQQLFDITLQVSLSSRVAVLGPNGAGKSTLVKLLIGDIEPNISGEVWKHPNLVIGYVAQHAFHHIDNHLDKTPLEYMLWRYQTGEDLEEMMKETRQITEEEAEKMKNGSVVIIEGQKRYIEEIVGRKKLKQSYEYECGFKGMSSADNMWFSRDELVKRGFEKKVMEVDTREAQRLGMMRPLVRKEIEKHFEDFGLESEFTTHNTMRGLSGGQKVKVVLGAATWRKPHVICLDEPTNYLDRESLAALIEALKVFGGGVLIITHNREFSESICSEVWWVTLVTSVEGQGKTKIEKKDDEEDKFDALGNKIVSEKKQARLNASELRKKKKERMALKKKGIDVDDMEEFDDI